MRLPLVLDEALAFSARHPVARVDETTRRRMITSLTSDPAGTIVVGDADGAIRVVATVIDVMADRAAPAEMIVLGARPGLPGAAFVDEVLAPARAFARGVGRRGLEIARPPFVSDADEVLAREGFAFTYATFTMRRPRADVDGPEPAPPPGWRWVALDEGLVAPVHAALLEMFADSPGTTMMPLDTFRRGAFASPPGYHLLLDGGAIAGLVRVSVAGQHGDVRILGRAPAYRGRGVGRLILDRGLRLLTAAGARTVAREVTATNEHALALYRAFDFEIVERTPMLAAAL